MSIELQEDQNQELSVLLLEDFDLDAELVEMQIKRSEPSWQVHRVSNKSDFEAYLKKDLPDVILSDYNLPAYSGMQAFLTVKELDLEIPFIMVTGALPEETAIECIKEGVDDYIIKSSLLRLNVAIHQAFEKRLMTKSLRKSEKRFKQIFEQAAVAIAAFQCPNLITRYKDIETINNGRIGPVEMAKVLKYLCMTDANEEAIELFKAKDQDHLKKEFFTIFDRTIFEWIGKCFEAMITGKRSAQHMVRAKNFKGETLYLRMKISIDPTDIEHFNVSMIDVTKEKKSESRINKLLARLEQTVDNRTKELKEANSKLQTQANDRERITKVLRDNYVQMTDSIIAAKRIQQLMLPSIQSITDGFSDAFVYLRPKDIVSGDFYWYYKRGTKAWVACVDCTGHGVPGAFMSMISSKILNQIVIEQQTQNTAVILKGVDDYIIKELKQHESNTRVSTGMDISLCCFDEENNKLHYSGAFHSLYHYHKGELQVLKGDRFAIGGTFKMEDKTFTEHTVDIAKGDSVYMLTDGYADQFGGPKNKKFMRKNFIQMLKEIQDKTMFEQEMEIKSRLQDWKSTCEQIDDILVMGISY